MSTSSTRKEFQGLLANLHERDLTSWERERLWEIFETHPEFILEYQEHCQLPAMFAALEDEELLRAGMTRPPRNIVSMPGAEQAPPRHSRSRSRSRELRLAGLAAVLVAGAMALPFLIQNEPSITMPAVPVEELEARWEINGLEDLEGIKALAEAREMAAADDRERVQENRRATASAGIAQAFPSGKRQAAAVSRRRSDLVRDDPADEGVALQGAAALANSRSPRGGESSGVHGTVPAAISFNHHVRPILSENCFYCHGPDESERKSGLRLDTPKGAATDLGGYAAIVPGDIAASELWARITASDADELMPPADSHRTLSSSDKEILRRWIEAGAEYEIHWAFQKPSRVAPPEPAQEHAAWPVNPIDQFVLADLEAEGLAPSPPAKARTLARRLHLDTTGLPPDPGEVDAFEKAFEGDPDRAVSERVDALLDSPHYGEKMALAWLDAARYADSNGFQQDGDSQQWPWRDWVVRAWNQNMPFDRFTIEQLAGDLLEKPSNDQLVATAFNRNHMLNGEGGAIAEEQRINYVIDRVDTTATTWLGLTMACAQCHSHKYDPITHRDYYQFFAFFNNIPETGGIDRKSGKRVGQGILSRSPVPICASPTKHQRQRSGRSRPRSAGFKTRSTTRSVIALPWRRSSGRNSGSRHRGRPSFRPPPRPITRTSPFRVTTRSLPPVRIPTRTTTASPTRSPRASARFVTSVSRRCRTEGIQTAARAWPVLTAATLSSPPSRSPSAASLCRSPRAGPLTSKAVS